MTARSPVPESSRPVRTTIAASLSDSRIWRTASSPWTSGRCRSRSTQTGVVEVCRKARASASVLHQVREGSSSLSVSISSTSSASPASSSTSRIEASMFHSGDSGRCGMPTCSGMPGVPTGTGDVPTGDSVNPPPSRATARCVRPDRQEAYASERPRRRRGVGRTARNRPPRRAGGWNPCRTRKVRTVSRLDAHSLAQLLDDPAEQPRHVHLGDAQLRTDLRLGHLRPEPHLHDPALTVVELLQQRGQGVQVLHGLHARVGLAQHVGVRTLLLARVAVGRGSVQRASE